MTLKKNDDIRLEITAFTSMGSGIGRYENMAVFVDGTAPGDEITAHIIKVKKNYAVGKLHKLHRKSKMRIQSDCEADARCGGCAYRHIKYESELEIKKQTVTDAMKRIGGIDLECEEILSIKEPEYYRNKAQIPVGMSPEGKIMAGFYSKKSHRIIDCDECKLQHRDFPRLVEAVKQYVYENPVTIYNEETGEGLLRHIYLRQGVKAGETMVCLVINGDTIPKKERLVKKLLDTGIDIKSVVLNKNKKDTNVVLGEACETIYGSDFIEDELCSLRFRISPLSFYQVNPEGTELLYKRARDYAGLTGGEILLDLYCGAGTIGMTMAEKARQVIGVEIIPQAIENAKENARLNGIENVRFICDDAKGAAKTLYDEGIRPDVVVVDPPRKGCSREVLETIAKMSPERVVYVSCDPATLARDCAVMRELGYEVNKLSAVDMFPRTVHVETVVQLVRKNPDTHIDFEISLDEFDLTSAESKATYQEIKDYVIDKFGLKVSTLYISQVKAKCGIIERENYNKGKEGHRVPKCPKEKEDAIKDALRHFRMV
ncbi:MAG: 23S rRNA (uracil(1939)-C(5))-methyltransferase RlmD [Clostridia bacterium]|nr:23S rRNA (uracil(1939)-C(5))-methyltransferase RlmD [Clostridia bacterium]